jgi:hypothetical protein
MKSDIKKKIKTFAELEMPLLIEKGFLNNLDLSIYNQNLRISPQTENEIILQLPCDIQFQSQYGGPEGMNLEFQMGRISNF